MPEDVHAHVRAYQAKMKLDKNTGFYSQQQAIIAIVREHKLLTEKNKKSDLPDEPLTED